ncbi:MAG: GNAT family N-acetyltransferase [Lentisphaerae bacterium GWF2_49_21]|nr:MAG: GNAT family N-acetyltransferase [Lentisphaerae bacterium GWF2_49_21]
MFIKVKDKNQIETVEKLAKDIWIEHYTPIIGKSQISYMLDKFQSAAAISSQIDKDMEYFLILDEGKEIGYMAVEQRKDELFLSKIYIMASMRGRGLGKKAVDFTVKIARKRKLGKIILTVNKNNLSSVKAYEKMGFVKRGTVIQDIGNGFVMDDYRMEKVI